MSNSNLKTFDNFYADLAQSAYTGRPNSLPKYDNPKDGVEINYSNDVEYKKEITLGGGQDLPHGGKVYLQPDPNLHIERDIDLPIVDDDSELVITIKV